MGLLLPNFVWVYESGIACCTIGYERSLGSGKNIPILQHAPYLCNLIWVHICVPARHRALATLHAAMIKWVTFDRRCSMLQRCDGATLQTCAYWMWLEHICRRHTLVNDTRDAFMTNAYM
jgi:hypothetical protein